MRVGIIGTGYVGLVSGICLAAKGHSVTCVDLNQAIVDRLNGGTPHIHERGLPELLSEVRRQGLFAATCDLDAALDGADLVLIAVGTPSKDGVIDLGQIVAAARSIGAYLRRRDRFLSVVVKSTVVPGTTDTIVRAAIEEASGKAFPAFGLGMNPEFLREGEAIEDFMEPDRIVLGHEDPETLARLEELYAPWQADKLRVNTRTAELIKYANNALLATQISAINEIANLATAIGGIDVMDVVRGVHLDKRWNPITQDGGRVAPPILTYLVPGCGFGGSCFPKDLQALRSLAGSAGCR
jgi:UDPglucose 6-dehydrogenase/GDP-mannose 6-dehydrogenase